MADEIRDLNAKIKIVGTVLWENPDITKIFATVTINLLEDISKYAYFDLVSRLSNVNTRQTVTRCYVTGVNYTASIIYLQTTTTSLHMREFNIQINNTLNFTSARSKNLLNTSESTENNSYMIPVKLIGYKS